MSTLLRCFTLTYFGISVFESAGIRSETIEIETPGDKRYLPLSQFRICLLGKHGEDRVRSFHVRACHDAHIALMSGEEHEQLMYEVVIDRYKDNATVIRRGAGNDVKTVAKRNDGKYLHCGKFVKLEIKIKGEELFLQRDSETIINSTYTDMPSSVYITVTTGYGATGTWRFSFFDKGKSTMPRSFQNLSSCPLDPQCVSPKLQVTTENSDRCNSRFSNLYLTCLPNGNPKSEAIYLEYGCSDTMHDECGKESLVMTGCISNDNSSCQLCKIDLFEKDITLECPGQKNRLFLMKDTSCNFYNEWTKYLTAVHFTYAPNVTTTTDFPVTTTTDFQIITTSDFPVITTPDGPFTTFLSTEDATETTSTMMLTTVSTLTSTSQATSSMKSTNMHILDESQQNSNSPLTIGIVVGATGLLFAVICAVILLIFIGRSKKADQNQSSTMTVINGDDYNGNQSIALPSGGNPGHGKYAVIQLQMEEHNYQELTTTSTYDYIDTSDIERKSAPTMETDSEKSEYMKQVDNVPDFQAKTNGDLYSVIDPAETGFNRSHDLPSIAKETESILTYSVLDPTVTGFDRSETTNVMPAEAYAILDPDATGFNRLGKANQSEYEMAKPLNDDQNTEQMLEQPYCSDYNKLGEADVQRVNENVYSHSVDNVYDSANHNANLKQSDDTYDHCVRQ